MLERPSNFIPPGNLKLVKNGSATVPMSAGLRYIVQVVDDYGVYPESKFATTVASRWPAVRAEYRMHYRNSMGKLKLGDIQVVPVQSDTRVVNMLAAHQDNLEQEEPTLDYQALEACLDALGKEVAYNNGNVHLDFAGFTTEVHADWKQVLKLVSEQLLKRGINVTVYNFQE